MFYLDGNFKTKQKYVYSTSTFLFSNLSCITLLHSCFVAIDKLLQTAEFIQKESYKKFITTTYYPCSGKKNVY